MSWRLGQSYSQDLRDRVLAAVAAGETIRQVAGRFGVSPSYVSKASARHRQTGETGARPQQSHRQQKLAPYADAIRAEVLARNDQSLEDLRRWLLTTHGVASSTGGMWNTLQRLGLTLKKSRSAPPSKNEPT